MLQTFIIHITQFYLIKIMICFTHLDTVGGSMRASITCRDEERAPLQQAKEQVKMSPVWMFFSVSQKNSHCNLQIHLLQVLQKDE